MKLKSFEELKETNLKGYCYYVDSWSMSMTSARSYQPECWIVLEDNSVECTVANRDTRQWTKTSPKETIARIIAHNPAIDGKTYQNLIEKI